VRINAAGGRKRTWQQSQRSLGASQVSFGAIGASAAPAASRDMESPPSMASTVDLSAKDVLTKVHGAHTMNGREFPVCSPLTRPSGRSSELPFNNIWDFLNDAPVTEMLNSIQDRCAMRSPAGVRKGHHRSWIELSILCHGSIVEEVPNVVERVARTIGQKGASTRRADG